MRTAQEIYAAYRIMSSLQLHQLRVAAVGKTICDRFSGVLDTRNVVLACLFHDMGNLIKSDLVTFPEFLEPEGYDYWKKVKDEFEAKYGKNEHHATIEIAGELALPKRAIELIDGVGFSKLETARDSDSYEQKIVEYADLRVGPYGILSMDDRIAESAKRYVGKHPDMPRSPERFAQLAEAAHEVERQLFSRTDIKPEDVNDKSTAALIEELRNYSIE
ncbi:MAG TPA: HD domain-containing protein [Candidatus Paceibacterota bacterium]|nr:HD domain-containing protein [Candidatus Paceibacterota bacterium]